MILHDAGGGVVTGIGCGFPVSAIDFGDEVAGIECISRTSGIDGMDGLRNGYMFDGIPVNNPASISAGFNDDILEPRLIQEIDNVFDRVGLSEQCFIVQ